MSDPERKTLDYLQNRDWIAIGAILEECPEATDTVLKSLHKRGWVDYVKYVGTGNVEFYKPTEKGKRALQPFYANTVNYIAQNWIALVGIILALAALIVGVIALKK